MKGRINIHQTSSLHRIRQVIILGSLTALAPLSIDMYLPSLPIIAIQLHAKTAMVQLSITFCLLGLAFGQLFGGPLSDRLGRRKPLLVGLSVYAITSALAAVTSSIWVLLLLRLLQGLSGAVGIVVARAIVRDHYSGNELTQFFALLMLVNGVAPIAAPVLGGQLLRITSWHGVFFVLFAAGFLMILSVAWWLPESLPHERRTQGGMLATITSMARLSLNRQFMGYALAQGFIYAAMFGYISGSPFVLQTIFGLSAQMFSTIFAMNGVGIIVAGQITARMARRYGEKSVLHVGLGMALIGGITLLIAAFWHVGMMLILPALFVIVASVGVVGTTATALAMQSHGKNAGAAAGLLGVTQMLLGAIASPMVGLGGSKTDWPMAIVIAVCEVIGVLVYITLGARESTPREARQEQTVSE